MGRDEASRLQKRLQTLEQENVRLRESVNQHRALFEDNPQPMLIYDCASLVFLAANRAAVRLYGYSVAEFLRMTIKEIRPPEEVPFLLETLARTGHGQRKSDDARHRKKDGSFFSVAVVSQGIAFNGRRARLAVVQDVTARKEFEEALRQSEERFRTLSDSTFEGIVFSESAVIKDTNEQFARMLGYRRDELIGQRIGDLVPTERRAEITTNIHTGREAVVDHEMIRKDGSRCVVEAHGRTIQQQGRPLRITSVRDITRRKQAEDALRRAHDELERRVAERTAELAQANERLKSKMIEHLLLHGEIEAAGERERERLGRELHDSLGQLLFGARLKADALAARLVGHMKAEARRAKAITDILSRANEEARALARGLEPVEREPDGLMSALQQLAETTRKLFGVTCRCELAEPVAVSDHAAATELMRIAQEAVNNAIKHGKARRVTIELTQDAAQTVLTVTNNGKSFPKRPRSTGMGLRTMRYRAERIGGVLTIESRSTGGTIVRCSLPHSRSEVRPSDPLDARMRSGGPHLSALDQPEQTHPSS